MDPAERSDTAAEIDQLIAKWKMLSEKNHDLVFSNFRNLESSLLVDASTDDLAAEERFPLMELKRCRSGIEIAFGEVIDGRDR